MNKVAIHQPTFLPYVGNIKKIAGCDVFIFLDDVQFDDGGFQNRNKILTKDGVKWITVPLKSPRYMRGLQEIEISYNSDWQPAMLQTLQYTYGKYPYFRSGYELMREILSEKFDYLVDLNIYSTMKILEYFGIKKSIVRSSDFPEKPSERVGRIVYLVEAVNGDIFLCGDKAKVYMDEQKFGSIQVRYQNYVCQPYEQKWSEDFIPYMSILDYIMAVGNDTSKF